MHKSDNKSGLNVPVWMTFGNSLRITNIVLLKFAWAACVIGGTFYGGIVLAGMFLTCHLQRRWKKEYPFFIVLGLVGTALDALWVYTGILDYGADTLAFGPLRLAPLWITFLWVGLGLSLFEVLSFFISRPILAAIIFAASAPFSYLAGAQFDAVVINSNFGLLAIAGSWLFVFYALFRIADSADKTETDGLDPVGGDVGDDSQSHSNEIARPTR